MKDRMMPDGAWQFDYDVASVFDDMLTRSIPAYSTMRTMVTDLAVGHLPDQGRLLDLGCSRGGAITPVVAQRPDVECVGFEISQPMIDAATDRFADNNRVDIVNHDLREPFPDVGTFDVVLSILTVQFTPIEHRQTILDRAFTVLRDGGMLILVEKVLGSDGTTDRLLIDRYYSMKRANGYTDEAIERKRLSLEGVLVPLSASWNVDALRATGFVHVDEFWRAWNFGGWFALKGR